MTRKKGIGAWKVQHWYSPVSEDIQVALSQQCLLFAAIWILESHYERGHGRTQLGFCVTTRDAY